MSSDINNKIFVLLQTITDSISTVQSKAMGEAGNLLGKLNLGGGNLLLCTIASPFQSFF